MKALATRMACISLRITVELDGERRVKLPTLHPCTWARDLLFDSCCTDKERSVIITGMYSLWTLRNKRRHGEVWPVKLAVQWAHDTAFDLWQLSRPKQNTSPAKEIMVWQPPEPGWTKCNVDGAFALENWHGAAGAVLRDHNGTFGGAMANWYANCMDALHAEALACRDGAVLARQAGVRKVYMETDCQEMVTLWNAGSDQRSSVMSVLREIWEISSSFECFILKHASRTCNMVAHTLAKQVSGDVRTGTWHEPPACIINLLAKDCNTGVG
ncbi:hypothetical protein EJB05_00719, partial [Eragrostis curvula]